MKITRHFCVNSYSKTPLSLRLLSWDEDEEEDEDEDEDEDENAIMSPQNPLSPSP